MPLCISASSSFSSSRQMHFNFTPLGLLLYRVSSTNWPLGLLFQLHLGIGKLSGLEEVDNVPCPSWSLRLGNED